MIRHHFGISRPIMPADGGDFRSRGGVVWGGGVQRVRVQASSVNHAA